MKNIHRNLILGVSMFALVFSGVQASGVLAHEDLAQSQPERVELQRERVEQQRERMEQQRESTDTFREQTRQHVINQREQMVDAMRGEAGIKEEETREEFRTRMEERRSDVQARVEEARTAQQNEMERRRAEFNERVQQIRDEQRRVMAERLGERVNSINDRLTDGYLVYLDRLEDALDRLVVRADEWKERFDIDDSGFNLAVEEARAGIVVAREAVLEQKEKVYIAEFESDEDLRRGFQDLMQELRADHSVLRSEYLQEAKVFVREAFSALRDAHVEFVQSRDNEDGSAEDSAEE